MSKPFPKRTILLMVLALLAFARLYWVSHEPPEPKVSEVRLVSLDGGQR